MTPHRSESAKLPAAHDGRGVGVQQHHVLQAQSAEGSQHPSECVGLSCMLAGSTTGELQHACYRVIAVAGC